MRRNSRDRRVLVIIAIELAIIGILFVYIGAGEVRKSKKSGDGSTKVSGNVVAGDTGSGTKASAVTLTPEPTPDPVELARLEEERRIAEEQAAHEAALAAVGGIIEEADLKAAMYDYDAAIALVEGVENYQDIEELVEAHSRYEELKSKCVLWPDNTTISHIFVHSLIVDTDRAFYSSSSTHPGYMGGYDQYMTTVYEFNKMIESMYEKGYVLISIHDIAKREVGEDGTEHLVKQDIWLPEGKTPFVLSQDDVNYYAYMSGDGFAEKIVIGEDGLPTCEYIEKDGTVVYGEYDMMPIIDRFVREHPDFSYHGAKGILALTGYEGALGYDTGLSMKIYDGMDETEKMKLIEAEREKATAVADALKADGWEFASHSYTHSNMTNNSVSKVEYDTNRWKEEVEPIVGDTDIYIYPYGADICDWRKYEGEKYDILKAAGFWYFCNVDGSRYWIQIRDQYFRMGRINTDGYRFRVTPEKLTYFFDVDEIFDPARPAAK